MIIYSLSVVSRNVVKAARCCSTKSNRTRGLNVKEKPRLNLQTGKKSLKLVVGKESSLPSRKVSNGELSIQDVILNAGRHRDTWGIISCVFNEASGKNIPCVKKGLNFVNLVTALYALQPKPPILYSLTVYLRTLVLRISGELMHMMESGNEIQTRSLVNVWQAIRGYPEVLVTSARANSPLIHVDHRKERRSEAESRGCAISPLEHIMLSSLKVIRNDSSLLSCAQAKTIPLLLQSLSVLAPYLEGEDRSRSDEECTEVAKSELVFSLKHELLEAALPRVELDFNLHDCALMAWSLAQLGGCSSDPALHSEVLEAIARRALVNLEGVSSIDVSLPPIQLTNLAWGLAEFVGGFHSGH